MKNFAAFSRRQFSDHLEGGALYGISKEASRGVPTHNMALERAFGYWDQLKRKVPGISSIAAEASTLVARNKTLDWLKEKPVNERNHIIQECQQQTPALKVKYQERDKQRKQLLESRLQQQQQEKLAKDTRESNKRLELAQKIEQCGGLWQSGQQMAESLSKFATKKLKMEAIKTQIQYRKVILRQSRKELALSCDGKIFTQEELMQNLISLMESQTESAVEEVGRSCE